MSTYTHIMLSASPTILIMMVGADRGIAHLTSGKKMTVSFTHHNSENMAKAIAEYGEHKQYVLALITMISSEGNKYMIVNDSRDSKMKQELLAAKHEDWKNHDIEGETLKDYLASDLADEGYIIVDTATL